MAEEIFTVFTDDEQVGLFMQWAEKYKTDFNLPELQEFQEADAKDVFKWLIKNYRREEDEIIVRPKVYLEIVQVTGSGLDCDDATIFWCALLRSVGVRADKILVAEVADPQDPTGYCHIFCGVSHAGSIVWLDNLPGSVFGKHSYDTRLMRVTTMSDYL